MSDPNTLVNKLWSYCQVLRDDGLSYGDYLEPSILKRAFEGKLVPQEPADHASSSAPA